MAVADLDVARTVRELRRWLAHDGLELGQGVAGIEDVRRLGIFSKDVTVHD